MDRPRDYYSKKEIIIVYKNDITYMWDLKKNDTNEFIYKTETDSQTENKFMVSKGERQWGRDKLGVGD